MDALERLTAYLCSKPSSEHMDEEYAAFAARLLRQHAHGLAEKIRAHEGALNGAEWHEFAAGLIDPEVTT